MDSPSPSFIEERDVEQHNPLVKMMLSLYNSELDIQTAHSFGCMSNLNSISPNPILLIHKLCLVLSTYFAESDNMLKTFHWALGIIATVVF